MWMLELRVLHAVFAADTEEPVIVCYVETQINTCD